MHRVASQLCCVSMRSRKTVVQRPRCSCCLPVQEKQPCEPRDPACHKRVAHFSFLYWSGRRSKIQIDIALGVVASSLEKLLFLLCGASALWNGRFQASQCGFKLNTLPKLGGYEAATRHFPCSLMSDLRTHWCSADGHVPLKFREKRNSQIGIIDPACAASCDRLTGR